MILNTRCILQQATTRRDAAQSGDSAEDSHLFGRTALYSIWRKTEKISNGVKEWYYNLKHSTGDEAADELLAYFKDSDPYYITETFPRIVERVRYFKIYEEGVDTMCEIADRIRSEGREEGKREGRKEGRIEGRLESKIEDILELLEELGKVPQRIVELIKAEDNLNVLRQWHKTAAKAGSIAEFEANM